MILFRNVTILFLISPKTSVYFRFATYERCKVHQVFYHFLLKAYLFAPFAAEVPITASEYPPLKMQLPLLNRKIKKFVS